MKCLSFKEAKRIYDLFVIKREYKQNLHKDFLNKFSFLILSNLFDRDFASAEYCVHETFFNIGKRGYRLDKRLILNLKDDEKATILIGKIFSNKLLRKINYNFKLDLKYFFKKFIFHSLRSLISFSDFILIFIYSLIFLIFIKPFLKVKYNTKTINEIYTITFLKSKKSKSIEYFYPDYNKRKSKISFITNFHDYKFLFNGIIQSSFKKNLVNGLSFINLKDLILSFLNLFIIYVWDLTLLRDFSFGKLLSYLESFRFINRKFYYLICFYSVKNLLRLKPKLFYIWTENQLHSKAISFILAKNIIKDKNLKTKCINYIGYPFFSNFHLHLEPSNFELKNNIWGMNYFMFSSKESLQEMKSSLGKINFKNYKLFLARDGLNRYMKSVPKLMNKNKNSTTRKLTLFSHSSISDFISMIKCLDFYRDKLLLTNEELIYVRTHPTLPVNILIKLINELNIFKIENFIFINRSDENVETSIIKSEYCIFSDSNIINHALSLKKKVIVFKTSLFFDPPIYVSNKNNKSLNLL